jgi:hypothetical protein
MRQILNPMNREVHALFIYIPTEQFVSIHQTDGNPGCGDVGESGFGSKHEHSQLVGRP